MGLESQEAFARPCRAPALLLETPLRDLPPEAKVASVPHSLSSAGSQTVFSFETQTKLACEIEKSVHVRFSGGGGSLAARDRSWQLPGFLQEQLTPTSANLCDPTLGPTTHAPREGAVTDALRALSFYFRSLFSAAGKTAKEPSGGGKPVPLTK